MFVEDCSDPKESVVVKQVELSQYLIEVSFNIPGQKIFDQAVLMDKRVTIAELKIAISQVIGIPPESLKLCRNLVRHEYKKLDQTLDDVGLFDGAAVIVERGTPLRPNQFHCKLLTYDMHKTEPWSELPPPGDGTEWVLDQDMPIADIKAYIASTLNTNPSFMRMRERVGNKLAKALANSKTLKECIPQLYPWNLPVCLQ